MIAFITGANKTFHAKLNRFSTACFIGLIDDEFGHSRFCGACIRVISIVSVRWAWMSRGLERPKKANIAQCQTHLTRVLKATNYPHTVPNRKLCFVHVMVMGSSAI